MKHPDVIVVGAGAIGLAIAYELTLSGKRVTVIDRDRRVAPRSQGSAAPQHMAQTHGGRRQSTSWAASGILPPANLVTASDPIDRLRGLSHQRFEDLTQRLKADSGIDSELERCGGMYLAETPGELAAMTGLESYWRELSIDCERIDQETLAEREPGLAAWFQSRSGVAAWWVKDEYQIRCPRYLSALTEACANRGVAFCVGEPVNAVSETASHAVVRVGERDLHAGQLVMAAGVWTGISSGIASLRRSLIPVRGQILLLEADRRELNSVINIGNRYLVPRRDGQVLVGSCEEEVGFQHGTTPGVLTSLRRFVRDVCPALAGAREVDAWSGLRPLTFDGFPMIGKLPGYRSVFVAAGHFRSGVHLSPGTALCVSALLNGETPPVDLSAFRINNQMDLSDPTP